MELTTLIENHRQDFRKKVVEALAMKNSMSPEQVERELRDAVDRFVDERYEPIIKLAERIRVAEKPVLLNIRRDRAREDKCKICESNEPNIQALQAKYGDRIEMIEIGDNTPESALYHVIFHEESPEKKLPLTAVIFRGDIRKYWAGKAVDVAVYERFLKGLA